MPRVHGSRAGGPDQGLLESARQMRWRVPELALMLSDRAVAEARRAGDSALRVRAEALAVFASNRLGRGVATTERALAVVREAEQLGDAETAGDARVELASCARRSGSHEVSVRVLRPVLDRPRVRPELRAHALVEFAGSMPTRRGISECVAALDEADRLYGAETELDGDTACLLRARVNAVRAAHHRRHAELPAAAAAAEAGLGLLRRLADATTDSGEIRGSLVLEYVHALLDMGRHREAVRVAEEFLAQPLRAASAAPAGWLRFALATRVHVPAGELSTALGLLTEALSGAERHDLVDLQAELNTTLSQLYERTDSLADALHCLRAGYAADRSWRSRVHGARLRLLEEYPSGAHTPVGVAVPPQQSKDDSTDDVTPPTDSPPRDAHAAPEWSRSWPEDFPENAGERVRAESTEADPPSEWPPVETHGTEPESEGQRADVTTIMPVVPSLPDESDSRPEADAIPTAAPQPHPQAAFEPRGEHQAADRGGAVEEPEADADSELPGLADLPDLANAESFGSWPLGDSFSGAHTGADEGAVAPAVGGVAGPEPSGEQPVPERPVASENRAASEGPGTSEGPVAHEASAAHESPVGHDDVVRAERSEPRSPEHAADDGADEAPSRRARGRSLAEIRAALGGEDHRAATPGAVPTPRHDSASAPQRRARHADPDDADADAATAAGERRESAAEFLARHGWTVGASTPRAAASETPASSDPLGMSGSAEPSESAEDPAAGERGSEFRDEPAHPDRAAASDEQAEAGDASAGEPDERAADEERASGATSDDRSSPEGNGGLADLLAEALVAYRNGERTSRHSGEDASATESRPRHAELASRADGSRSRSGADRVADSTEDSGPTVARARHRHAADSAPDNRNSWTPPVY